MVVEVATIVHFWVINGTKKNERYRKDKVKFDGANASGILILQEHGCNS